jgi:hypothetical protein
MTKSTRTEDTIYLGEDVTVPGHFVDDMRPEQDIVDFLFETGRPGQPPFPLEDFESNGAIIVGENESQLWDYIARDLKIHNYKDRERALKILKEEYDSPLELWESSHHDILEVEGCDPEVREQLSFDPKYVLSGHPPVVPPSEEYDMNQDGYGIFPEGCIIDEDGKIEQ